MRGEPMVARAEAVLEILSSERFDSRNEASNI